MIIPSEIEIKRMIGVWIEVNQNEYMGLDSGGLV